MSELKMLYKIIYDDLKDADMMIEYAKKFKEDNKKLADQMMANAKVRLSHALSTHEQFVTTAKTKQGTSETMHACLWEVTHEHYTEWYEQIESCINKWK